MCLTLLPSEQPKLYGGLAVLSAIGLNQTRETTVSEQYLSPRCTVWSGGGMLLDKLSVPGNPTDLDNSRVRAYWARFRCWWGHLGHFSLVFLF